MVGSDPLPAGTVRRQPDHLRGFAKAVFTRLDLPDAGAALVADVLVTADLPGTRSHGVARITYLLVRLERGRTNPTPRVHLQAGSDTTGTLDADNGIVAAGRASRGCVKGRLLPAS